MKSKQKLNSKQGITLIALVITIIMVLILVVVSVQLTLNTGVFISAGNATQKYKSEQEKENDLKLNIDSKTYDSIEDYQNGIESITEVHNWQKNEDTITCSHCSATYTIGDEVAYTKTGTGSSIISGELSGVSQGIAVGDLSEDEFGIDGEQTIVKDEETSWVVFGIEDKNNNGTNETLLLTTAMPTESELTLYGEAAYNNVVTLAGKQGIIDKICKDLYGQEARGITIKDINNCLGYEPSGAIYDDENGTQTTGNFNTTLSSLTDVWTGVQAYNTEYCESKYYTPSNIEGTTDSSILGNIVLDGYYYYVSEDGTYLVNEANDTDTSNIITDAKRNVVYGTANEYCYFLANKGTYGSNTVVNFGTAYVNSGETYSYGTAFSSEGYRYPMTYTIRPIITIISETPEKVITEMPY